MNDLIYTLGRLAIFAIGILAYLYYNKIKKHERTKLSMLSYILYDKHPIKELIQTHYQGDNHKVLYSLLRDLSRQKYMSVNEHNMFYINFAGFIKKAKNELRKSISTEAGKELIENHISFYIKLLQPKLKEQMLLANKMENNKLQYESVVKDILEENINPDEATFIKLFSEKLNLSLKEATQKTSELKEIHI